MWKARQLGGSATTPADRPTTRGSGGTSVLYALLVRPGIVSPARVSQRLLPNCAGDGTVVTFVTKLVQFGQRYSVLALRIAPVAVAIAAATVLASLHIVEAKATDSEIQLNRVAALVNRLE